MPGQKSIRLTKKRRWFLFAEGGLPPLSAKPSLSPRMVRCNDEAETEPRKWGFYEGIKQERKNG